MSKQLVVSFLCLVLARTDAEASDGVNGEHDLPAIIGRMLGVVAPVEITKKQVLNEPIRIIGAGLGRTGSSSLRLALQEMGYETYHMTENVEKDHMGTWSPAAEAWLTGDTEGYKANVRGVLRMLKDNGYNATTDYPACVLYQEMLAEYPNAKVILSVRDSPEKWAHSIDNSIHRVSVLVSRFPLSVFAPHMTPIMRWVWKRSHVHSVPVQERGWFDNGIRTEDAVRGYNQWIHEVKANVPAEKLLLHNANEGWGPLCRFLDTKVCPTSPFPRVNEQSQFTVIVTVLWIVVYLWPVLVALMGLGCYWCVRRCCGGRQKEKQN